MNLSSRLFATLAAVTIFLSAFLLFQVQPLISKAILPWFGGTPAVWTTSMLFFQVALLAGYLYAHQVGRLGSARAQFFIHLGLLIAAISLLPIMPADRWKPVDGRWPVLRILALLVVTVGMPYFLLSTTGPLLQVWFTRRLPGRSPYRLYALSNLGSLLALVSYPFVVERWLSVPSQAYIWSGAFVLFALLCAVVAAASQRGEVVERVVADESAERPKWRTMFAWVAYPMIAVVALLAVTQHVCRDVAVVPLLWIVPLTLYLLSFIICFDREKWYVPRLWALLALLATLIVFDVMLRRLIDQFLQEWQWLQERGWSFQVGNMLGKVYVEAPIYFVWLFLACMLCHGELVRTKPSPRYLTHFYFALATGGALGGVFTAAVCPYIFSNYWELYLVLAAVLALAIYVIWTDGWEPWLEHSWVFSGAFIFIACVAAFMWAWALGQTFETNVVARVRGFYGMLTVQEWNEDDPNKHGYALYNGHILHGYQFLSPERSHLPTTYYAEGSGPHVIINYLRTRQQHIRYGVIGLGTATLAAYGQSGDYVCFYEINPDVIDIQQRYFTYYRDCPAEKLIVVGDARIQMERQESQQFDALFVDAFSGDAIPAHLLTREALEIYRRHVKPDGLIAFHISNRYLDLVPVVAGLAQYSGMKVGRFVDSTSGEIYECSSDWVVLTQNDDFLDDEEVSENLSSFQPTRIILWTDQYSSLFELLQ